MEERLKKLEGEVAAGRAQMAEIGTHCKEANVRGKRIEKALMGEMDADGKEGLIAKVRRLEARERGRGRAAWLALATAIGLVVRELANGWTGK